MKPNYRTGLMLLFVCAGAVTLSASPLEAQEDRERILSAVQQFFDAMASGDTAAMSGVLVMDGQYHRVREGVDEVSVQRNTFSDFVRGMPANTEVLLERMWDQVVLQHGPIAVVWTPYDFYRNSQHSHCGVDAFTLVRTRSGWKITGIAYTVEQRDCPTSPLGPPR